MEELFKYGLVLLFAIPIGLTVFALYKIFNGTAVTVSDLAPPGYFDRGDNVIRGREPRVLSPEERAAHKRMKNPPDCIKVFAGMPPKEKPKAEPKKRKICLED